MKTGATEIVINTETQRARSCAEDNPTQLSTPRRQDAKTRTGIVSSFAPLLLCAFALTPLYLGAATNDLSGLLQKGLFEEEANRNLEAAVQAYQSLVTAFDQDRKLAATAVFRLGECYRKLGKTNEAVLQYDRIVREFTDEATLTTLSRQNLTRLMSSLPSPGVGSFQERLKEIIAKAGVGVGTNTDFERRLRSIIQSAADNTSEVQSVPVDDEETEIRRLQAMIQNSPDLINAPGQQGNLTPLCQAANAGWLRVATFLLDHGAAIDRKAGNQTPLYCAVSRGNKAMVDLLLQRGADVNAKDGTGGTALHEAAQDGFLSVAEVLVQHKADLNPRNSQMNRKQTPLHLAVAKGHQAMVEFLMAQGADLDAADTAGFTPLLLAYGHAQLLEKLLAAGAKRDVLDKQGRTALSYAAMGEDLDCVAALLAAKADPNAGKLDLPIHAAIHWKNLKILEALLNAGADVNRSAPVSYKITTSSMTIASGAIVTPLSLAIVEGNTDAVRLLLKRKADPNGLGPGHYPVILDAGYTENLKALLEAGARPNVDDGQGCTPLSMAAAGGHADSVSILLAHGADKEVRWNGLTPLLHAVHRQDQKSVEALLKAGADVNARDRDEGCTALHLATFKRDATLCTLLLAHKADVNARDNHGLTPLDIANGKEAPRRNPGPAIPSFGPGLPPPGVASAGSTPAPAASAASLAELLRQHGAKEGTQLPEPAKAAEKQ